MNSIAALGADNTVAFHGFYQDYCRLFLARDSLLVGSEDFTSILASALNLFDFIVTQSIHHPLQLRVSINPVFPLTIAGQHGITLVITIYTFFHATSQCAINILCQEFVPAAAPDHFDDIPAGTVKRRF